ncbi:MAG: bifunctional nuclease family protein [Armatimonadota bacterium]
MRKMKVDKLGIDLITRDPVVILKDVESQRYLPILIGPFEATAIALALEGTPVPRPLTHDLMRSIIDSVGAKVLRVVIADIQDNTFYAKIVIESNSNIIEVDARPSDSIALSLRTNAPIYVSEKIILEESIIDKESEDQDYRKFKKYLDNLKPEDFSGEEGEEEGKKDKKDKKNKKDKDKDKE